MSYSVGWGRSLYHLRLFLPVNLLMRRGALAAALVLAGLAGCSSNGHHAAPPVPDGGTDGSHDVSPHDGAGGATHVDGGTDGSHDACGSSGAKQAAGGAVVCNGQCQSGFCVDGVCCSSACTGGCQTCAASGSLGTCTKRTSGAMPRSPSDCPVQPVATCGTDGTCDGAGACHKYFGSVCIAGTCSGSAVVGAYACDGTGQCKPGVTTLCQPYACDSSKNACFMSCTANNQCSAQVCDFATGSCGKSGPGGHCSGNDDWISGFCSDDVCCNVACQGACVACNLSGRRGTCWPIAAGVPDPRGSCKDTGAGSCGHDGTCDGVGGCANYVQDVECLAPTCTGNRLNTAGTCDGLGTCGAPGVRDCH